MKDFEAIVIGGGPAGMTAALYLTRAGYNVALVEKAAPGGQVLSTAEIENYPGFPNGVRGWELADLFSAHLDAYPVQRVRADVAELQAGEKLHTLVMAEGAEALRAPAIIIATGARHKSLGVEGEERLAGKGVSYCAVCDGNFYRNLDVAVIGGGNSALEESLYLSRIVRKIYLIHRRDEFRGARVYVDKIRAVPDKIELVTSHVVDFLEGGVNLEAVHVRHVGTGEKRRIPVDGVFVYVGNSPNGAFLPESLPRSPQGFILTDQEMRTELPGIFAAGDIRVKACRQVSSAVGDGATAATAAITYLEQLNA